MYANGKIQNRPAFRSVDRRPRETGIFYVTQWDVGYSPFSREVWMEGQILGVGGRQPTSSIPSYKFVMTIFCSLDRFSKFIHALDHFEIY
jgi:hypothetical protein